MIEIRACGTGQIVLRVPAETLAGREFRGLRLSSADFAHMLLNKTDFSHAALAVVDFQETLLEDSEFNGALRPTVCSVFRSHCDHQSLSAAMWVLPDGRSRTISSMNRRTFDATQGQISP